MRPTLRFSYICSGKGESAGGVKTEAKQVSKYLPTRRSLSTIIHNIHLSYSFKAVASHGNGISGPMRVIVVILASIYCVG